MDMRSNNQRLGRLRAHWPTPAPAVVFAVLAAMALSVAGAEVAVAASAPPAASTAAATNVTNTSATLNGIVTPNQSPTTYFFQYGTTGAPYGAEITTPTQGPLNGNAAKPVSANVTGLKPSTTYHFRVVAKNAAGTTTGSDLTFTTAATGGTSTNAVTISSRPSTVTYGSAATIAGQLSGPGNAGAKVTLEASPYPYTGAFKPAGPTATTNTKGGYSFAVTPAVNTHYQVTVKKLSVTSPQVAVTVRVKVTLRLSTRNPTFGGLVRFSGTVTPAHNGKVAQIQRRTSTGAWGNVASATLVAAAPVNGIAVSSFSTRLRLRSNATYRVSVSPNDGDHAAGTSSPTGVTVHVKVTLRLGTLRPAVGQLVRFSGTVTPAHNGKVAQIQRRTSTGGWRTVASATLVAARPVNGVTVSKFSKRLRISRNGTYRVRVNPKDGDHGVGNSPTRTVRVH
jgi:hypothetical protein